MEDFRNFKKSKNFKQLVIQVSDNEEEADALYVEVIRNLHVNHADEPMHVLKWSRLYASWRAAATPASIPPIS